MKTIRDGLPKLLHVPLIAAIHLAVGSPYFAASPEPPGSSEVARWADDVEILRTDGGVPMLRLHARKSRTNLQGQTELTDVRLSIYEADGGELVVVSPRAISMPEDAPPDGATNSEGLGPGARAAQGPGSWLLEGGVTLTAQSDFTMKTKTLAFFESTGAARTNEHVQFTRGALEGVAAGLSYDAGIRRITFPGPLTATVLTGGLGRVRLEATSGSCQTADGVFEARHYTTLTGRGEKLNGALLRLQFAPGKGGLSRIEGTEGFQLETTALIPMQAGDSPLARLLAVKGRRSLTGDRLTVDFSPEGEPATVEVLGHAGLVAPSQEASGSSSKLAAETLRLDLAHGDLTRALAQGGVELQGGSALPSDAGFRLNSEHLEAAFSPEDGSILHIEGMGDIRISDRGLESAGATANLDPTGDILSVTGRENLPATASWLGRRIQATRTIQIDRRNRTLSAVGGVRGSYRPETRVSPSTPEQGLPFFRTTEPIHLMAGALTLADQGAIAKYRDHVRLWQGENRIEALEIDVEEKAGRLEARGDVTSAFHESGPSPPAATGTSLADIVTVTAGTMAYDRTSRRINYGGGVHVTRTGVRITTESLAILLSSDSSRAERFEASGNVEVRDSGRIGRGDQLSFDITSDTLVLHGAGREAVVQDESGQQVVRGRSLTLDRAGDRILVESERAGRSWITLKPRKKGAPGVGSDPLH